MNRGSLRGAPMWAALAVAAALLVPGAASADITYSTSSPTPTVTLSVTGFGTSTDTITFASQGSTTVSSTPADIVLGNFTWQQTNFGLAGGSTSAPFDLQVTQTQPAPSGSGTYTGDLSATFAIFSGLPDLSFSNDTITIGNETYQLETKKLFGSGYNLYTAGTELDLPTGSTGLTLYAHLTSSESIASVPEPSTVPFILLGAMVGSGAWYRRRRSA